METLHFFGVFDGHGGAEAALHCAQTLHQRIAEALAATVEPDDEDPLPEGGPLLLLVSNNLNTTGAPVVTLCYVPELNVWQLKVMTSSNASTPGCLIVWSPAMKGRDCAVELGLTLCCAKLRSVSALALSTPRRALCATVHPYCDAGPSLAASMTELESHNLVAMPSGLPAVLLPVDEEASSSSDRLVQDVLDSDAPDGQQDGKIEGVACSSASFESALTSAFNRTDEEFGKADNAALVGTTAIVALVGSRQLYVANCGVPPPECALSETEWLGPRLLTWGKSEWMYRIKFESTYQAWSKPIQSMNRDEPVLY